MAPKIPHVTAREIVAVLRRRGFSFTRQSGSHAIYINTAGKRTTVPVHPGKTLHPKTLKSILKDAELSTEELIKLL